MSAMEDVPGSFERAALPPPGATHIDEGCLPAIIPAAARSISVEDLAVVSMLAGSGATLVSANADVLISPIGRPEADAECVVLCFSPAAALGYRRVPGLGAARRMVSHALVRVGLAHAKHTLKRAGYPYVRTLLWDRGRTISMAGLHEHPQPWWERPPQRGFAIGARKPDMQTVLDAALVASGVHGSLGITRLLGKSEQCIAIADGRVLRVAVGQGTQRITRHRRALSTLHASALPTSLKGLIPRALGQGKAGLGYWSSEDRLPGLPGSAPLDAEVVSGCVDFLVALHAAGGDEARVTWLADASRVVADLSEPRAGYELLRLAAATDAALVDVPRGFGHGDFFPGNLLLRSGRLAGVIDWDSAGDGRLPLLDLLHLRLRQSRDDRERSWGSVVVDSLLPWATGGGDDIVRSYCDRIGIDDLVGLLPAFVTAYWLDRLSYQLAGYPSNALRPVWMKNNVYGVLKALA